MRGGTQGDAGDLSRLVMAAWARTGTSAEIHSIISASEAAASRKLVGPPVSAAYHLRRSRVHSEGRAMSSRLIDSSCSCITSFTPPPAASSRCSADLRIAAYAMLRYAILCYAMLRRPAQHAKHLGAECG